ncbi:MAG TPA: hypothetical protein VMN03_10630, partial [Burkholderiales bacterium]|nr:hypothetical protein [Burkholderiales bacterium]
LKPINRQARQEHQDQSNHRNGERNKPISEKFRDYLLGSLLVLCGSMPFNEISGGVGVLAVRI